MIEMRGVVKYFHTGGVNALSGVDFDLRFGEIHALLGENGAGKSTLMQILAGYLRPSGGRILIEGREIGGKAGGRASGFASPGQALRQGIGMLRQHPQITPGLKVWEDCILGSEERWGPFLDRRRARSQVSALNERWGFGLRIDSPTEALTVSNRQKAAVLALLLRNARCLIFDEPSAVLTPPETEALFALLRQLRAEGKAVVLISHKIEETLDICDRVSILARGKKAGVYAAASLTPGAATALMFGLTNSADLSTANPPEGTPVGAPQGPVLSLREFSAEIPGRPPVRRVDLDLYRGRILGIAGVRDSGLESLELSLTGFLPPTGGSVSVEGRTVYDSKAGPWTPGRFRSSGGAYLSALTMGEGLSVMDCAVIHAHRRALIGLPGRLGLMNRAALIRWTARILDAARIRRDSGEFGRIRRDSGASPVSSFSGGMVQRLNLERELAEEAPFAVLAEPGRGLDRRSWDILAAELRQYVRQPDSRTGDPQGRGILVISTDTEELIALCDDILVLQNGAVSARIGIHRPEGGLGEDALGDYRKRIGAAMVGEAARG
jgi:simple sugar transport system ATP-binding protein